MNAIAVFQRLRAAGRRAFIPFLPAGDPDVAATVALARTLAEAGADILELGSPYSAPTAAGPVIQASYTRALDRGVRLADMFACARRITDALGERLPLVAMTSYSLVHRGEPAAFLDR